MRKYLLLIILLLPFTVLADSYTIKTKVSVDGIELKEDMFKFTLKDHNGNIVQTKSNDKDGNVTFDPIEWNENGIETWYKNAAYTYGTTNNMYHIYFIEQIDNKVKGYTFDYEKTYVMVSDNGKTVKYFKYPSEEKLKADMPHYEWNPYHATDEELQGQAYFVYDTDTQEITVFRDEPNKYTNRQREGNKIYYILDETENGAISFKIDQEYRYYTKKITIKDPIRPTTGYALFYWFENLEEIEGIEKLDTSRMTSMHIMFQGDKKLKVIDLTHFDFSSVTNDNYGFEGFISNMVGDDENFEREIRIGEFNSPDGTVLRRVIVGDYNKLLNVKSDFKWFNNKTLGSFVDSNNVLLDYIKVYNGLHGLKTKYFDVSDLKLHLLNRYTYEAYGAVLPGAEGLFENIQAYYVDISGITSDYCAYQSIDFRFFEEGLRIFKISEQNSSQGGFIDTINLDERRPFFLYNIDHNLVSSELSYNGGGFYYLETNGGGWESCDRYYHGGTWINIVDDETEYHNLYVKPSIVKGVTENPKTGIISYTLKSFIILIIMLIIYLRIFGRSYFKRY